MYFSSKSSENQLGRIIGLINFQTHFKSLFCQVVFSALSLMEILNILVFSLEIRFFSSVIWIYKFCNIFCPRWYLDFYFFSKSIKLILIDSHASVICICLINEATKKCKIFTFSLIRLSYVVFRKVLRIFKSKSKSSLVPNPSLKSQI